MKTHPSRARNLVAPVVQRRRVELGWSQSKRAAECQLIGWDISRGIVAGIEGRVRCVTDYELYLLATALGLPLDALYPTHIEWKEIGFPHISLKKGTRS